MSYSIIYYYCKYTVISDSSLKSFLQVLMMDQERKVSMNEINYYFLESSIIDIVLIYLIR
jgi:hypothetical protein